MARGLLLCLVALVMCLVTMERSVEGMLRGGNSRRGSVAGSSCTLTHRVAPGHSCDEIAETYKLATTTLKEFNPDVDCKHLLVGTKLCLN
ncbi:hypothetical protein RvY_04769 [Ramazzottius varieornatus]|uniref:LysM domain-containing protein n=1 Tax=Ramazzottius varieornatus TaxID=947166 RepID=A0A1D1UYD9_RAMVA|nr:hypothetical protein RvY_04769 [Ramazzottius varieornatus]